MKWFRSRIKHGSWLALFALVVQFAVSFGHFHAVAAQAAIQSGSTPSELFYADGLAASGVSESAQQQAPSNPDSDQSSNDPCAICAVIALANTVLFATPPVLLLPQAVEFLHLATDAAFVRLNAVRVAFQPRAPPRLLTSID